MRYKNIIIQCKDNKEFSELQNYLFKLSYNWLDHASNTRNNQVRKSFAIFSVLIQNSDTMRYPMPEDFELYKVVNFTQLIRNEKLKRINNV